MKVHEHSSTSVINREALELHTKRNLKLQLVNSTSTESTHAAVVYVIGWQAAYWVY